MVDRDRVIELISKFDWDETLCDLCTKEDNDCCKCGSEKLADHLLANDVTKVVRCKDCMHWGDIAYGFICRKFSGIDTKICMGSNQYCSYGELKELGK